MSSLPDILFLLLYSVNEVFEIYVAMCYLLNIIVPYFNSFVYPTQVFLFLPIVCPAFLPQFIFNFYKPTVVFKPCQQYSPVAHRGVLRHSLYHIMLHDLVSVMLVSNNRK